MVAAVRARTPAAAAGLAVGDRILTINGRALRDAIDFQFYGAEDRLALTVERDGARRALRLARGARGRAGRGAGGAASGRHRHLRQQVRVLLHPPAAQGDAQEPLRQGRRLPAVVPARQLHHAERSGRALVRAHPGAAAVAALRLGARDRPRAALGAARQAAALGGDPAPAGAAGQGRHPDPRADRAVPGPQRRAAPGADGARAGPAAPARGDHRHRAGRAHAPSRAAALAAHAHRDRGGGARRHRGRLAGALPAAARQPLRLPRRRGLPAGRAAAAARPTPTRDSRSPRTASASCVASRTA